MSLSSWKVYFVGESDIDTSHQTAVNDSCSRDMPDILAEQEETWLGRVLKF